MAMVISVEHLDLVLNGTVVSGSLTKGQDIDNCVPFTSHHASTSTGGYLDRLFCDVYFSDAGGTPTVRAERPDSSGAVTVSVYVVEFDPAEVSVQSGEINFSTTTDSDTLGSTVDTSRTAMVFNHQVTGTGSTAAYAYYVTGDLSSTQVSWTRGVATGTIEGHYFVFEALDDQFKVTRSAGNAVSATVSDTKNIISNWRKTFVVGSYRTVYGGDDPQYSSAYGYMLFRNQFVLNRLASSGDMSFVYFVIEFLDTEKTHVEQGYKSLTSTTGVQTDTANLARSFDLDYSMVMPILTQGVGRAGGSSYSQSDGIFTGMSFNSASQIAIKRNTIGQVGYTYWQVVDWQGVTHTKAAAATPLEDTIVKTVETVPMTLDTTNNRLYRYYELSKGQDISNCVVFETHRATGTGGYPGRVFANVWLEEPNLIGISKGNYGGTLNSNAFVVEFDPEHVKVQQGELMLKSVTSNTTTISGVDLNKTAMIHYAETRGANTITQNFVARGRFTNSTTAEFTRGSTVADMVVSYFIFEALNDEFEVDTYTNSASAQYTINITDAVRKHHAFLLSSYYLGYAGDDPQYAFQRSFIADEHNAYANGNAYSSSYYHNIFLVTLNYAPDKILVQRKKYTHATGTDIETSALDFNVNLDSSIINNPMRVLTRSAGSSFSQNPNAIVRYKFNDVDEMQFYRDAAGQAAYSNPEIIDWVGHAPTEYTPSNIQQGMIKSIERMENTYSGKDDYYYYLTKGQDVSNCVPFPTNSADSSTDYFFSITPIFYLYEPNILKVVRRDSAGTIDLGVDVVEFNPNEVKIQSGEIFFSGASTTATIEAVDTSKAFVVAYTHVGSNTTLPYQIFVRTRFTNSTTLEFTRGNAIDYIRGYYWVIEDIADNFDVAAYSVSSAASPIATIPSATDVTKTAVFGSHYCANGSDDPQYHFARLVVRAQEQMLYLNRAASSSTMYMTMYTVTFKDPNVRVIHIAQSYGTGDSSKTTTISTSVDPDKCITTCINTLSVGRLDSATSYTQNGAGMFKAHLNVGGTQVTTERDQTGLAAHSSAQVIEFPLNTHYFSGNVTENNVAATRQVFVFDRDTGALEKAVTSSGTGGYYLAETTNSGTQFIIALDHPDGDQFNLMGLDLMDPLPID